MCVESKCIYNNNKGEKKYANNELNCNVYT
jgi:hypothetical protein